MSLLVSRNITGGTELLTNPTLDSLCAGWDKTENGAGNTVTFNEGYANIKTVVNPPDDNGLRQYVTTYYKPVVVKVTIKGNNDSLYRLYSYSSDSVPLGTSGAVNAGETKTITWLFPSIQYRVVIKTDYGASDFDVLEFSMKPLLDGTPTQQRLIASTGVDRPPKFIQIG